MGSLLSIYTQADLKAYVENRLDPEDEEDIRTLIRSDDDAHAWVTHYRQQIREQEKDVEMKDKLTKTEARQATENGIARRVLLVSMLAIAAIALLLLVLGPGAFA